MGIYDGMTPEQIEARRKYHREYYRAHKEEICKRRRENFQCDCAHGGYMRQYRAEYAKAHRQQHSEANHRSYVKRKAHIAALKAENAALKEENKRLKEMLGKEAQRGETRIDA